MHSLINYHSDSAMSGYVFAYKNIGLHNIGDPYFFQGEMVPWQYLLIRRSKAGGMNLINCKELKTCKDLKCPAVRLMGLVHLVLSRPFISLEKNRGLRYLENQSDTYAKT
jgi:hypothetical protein